MDESKTLAQIFTFEGHDLQVIIHNDKPAFIGKQVCEALGIVSYRDALSVLPDHQKDDVGISDAIGRIQNTKIVYEGGVYRLAFRSNKPEAQEFTDLVTDVILPSIRKTGKYEIPPLAKSITQIPASMNRYLDMAEQQKLDALTKLMEDARNLEYSVQDNELHLQMKLICFHAFGILNNWNAPLEENDKLLLELLQMRLDIQEQHTKSFNHASVEQRIQDFVQTHMKPLVFRLR